MQTIKLYPLQHAQVWNVTVNCKDCSCVGWIIVQCKSYSYPAIKAASAVIQRTICIFNGKSLTYICGAKRQQNSNRNRDLQRK